MKTTLLTTSCLALLAALLLSSCQEQVDDAGAAIEKAADATAEKTKEAVEATKEATGNAVEATKEKTAEAAAATAEKATDLKDAAAEKTKEAVEATKEATGNAVEATKDAASNVAEATKEKTAAAAAATAEKATNLKDAAAEKTKEAVEATKEATSNAVEATKEKAADAAAATKDATAKAAEKAKDSAAKVMADTKANTDESSEKLKDAASKLASSITGTTEWAQWGRDGSNNMVANAKNIPSDFTGGEVDGDGNVVGAKHAKWVVKMGSQAYGTTTVKDGRVFLGTNNEEPRIESIKGDKGIVMCLDEETGDLQWQLAVPKLGAGKVSDWEFLGICSSIAIEGKYGYVVTNRGEILCLDVYGMSDGNDGPFTDEAKYANGGLEKLAESDAATLAANEADIVWGYDIRSELGAFPHNITSSSVVLTKDHIYASTSNGVDWSHINIPAPNSPSLIALDKKTGELAGEELSGISERVMHCNWSSPAAGKINGVDTVVFGAGDGWTYGYQTGAFEEDEEGFMIMKELWKVDCCPQEYRFKDGEPIKYATYPGPSEIISSPVIYNDKVYAAIGQDPEHGEGVGALTCIDPSKGNGEDAIVWQFKGVGRTISTPSVADGICYLADYSGRLYAVDAENGELLWEHDTFSHIWGSTLVADGKVFLGNEDGELVVLKHGREKEEIDTISYPAPIYGSPVVANGVLYVMTQTHLYAYAAE